MEAHSTQSTGTLAVVLASGAVLVPMVLGRLIEVIVKSVNPSNVDVTQPLAYLGPLLVTGTVIFAVYMAVTVFVIVSTGRRHGPEARRVAWTVLAFQVILVAALLALQIPLDGLGV